MKKFISVSLLCMCLLMCLSGCGKSTDWLSESERTAIEESLLNEFSFETSVISDPVVVNDVKLCNNTGYALTDLKVFVNGKYVASCSDFYEGRQLERALKTRADASDKTVSFQYSIGGYDYTSPEYPFEASQKVSGTSNYFGGNFADYSLIIRTDGNDLVMPFDRFYSKGFDRNNYVNAYPIAVLNDAGTYWIWPENISTYSFTDIGGGMVDILLDIQVDSEHTMTMYGPQPPSKLLKVVARIVDENGMVLATDVLDELGQPDCLTMDTNALHFEFCTDSRVLYLEFVNS